MKIGYSSKPVEQIQERLEQIRYAGSTVAPEGVDLATLEVLDATVGIQSLEFWLHGHFAKARLCGEWFSLGPNPALVVQYVRHAIAQYEAGANKWTPQASPAKPISSEVVVEQPAAVVPEPALVVPEVADQLTDAQIHFALFSEWVKAGFTRDDALQLLTLHPSFPRVSAP